MEVYTRWHVFGKKNLKKNTKHFLHNIAQAEKISLKRVSLQKTGNWLKCIL